MFELIELKTGRVIERHNYSFQEFIENKYSRFCSLQTENGLIIGDVRPDLVWREVK